jgi:hypothetical protein
VDALAPGACDDTRLFAPLSGVDKAGLQKAVDAVKARGATPIVGSLLAAAGDFSGASGQRMIVLVTDGQESCGGDLAAAVAKLKAMQPPVALRVIGFDLPPRRPRPSPTWRPSSTPTTPPPWPKPSPVRSKRWRLRRPQPARLRLR